MDDFYNEPPKPQPPLKLDTPRDCYETIYRLTRIIMRPLDDGPDPYNREQYRESQDILDALALDIGYRAETWYAWNNATYTHEIGNDFTRNYHSCVAWSEWLRDKPGRINKDIWQVRDRVNFIRWYKAQRPERLAELQRR